LADPVPAQPDDHADGSPGEGRRGPGRNLPVATLTGLVLLGIVSGALYLDRRLFVVVLFVIVVVSLVELLTVLRRRGTTPAAPVAYVAAGVLVFGAYWQGTAALSLGILIALVAGFGWYLLDGRRVEVTRNLAVTIFACVYVPFAAAHLSLVVREYEEHYLGAIIGYALVVAAYDTFAYAVGVLWGRRPLLPSVSPAKSVEGAAGGTAAALAFGGLVLPLLEPWTLASGLTFALIACVVAPLGDLAESMLKRDLQVKDMGFLLPGHGGMLDRVDALLLSGPVLYYVLLVFAGDRW
jgi:phosphatidate cytidylyltransferase